MTKSHSEILSSIKKFSALLSYRNVFRVLPFAECLKLCKISKNGLHNYLEQKIAKTPLGKTKSPKKSPQSCFEIKMPSPISCATSVTLIK